MASWTYSRSCRVLRCASMAFLGSLGALVSTCHCRLCCPYYGHGLMKQKGSTERAGFMVSTTVLCMTCVLTALTKHAPGSLCDVQPRLCQVCIEASSAAGLWPQRLCVCPVFKIQGTRKCQAAGSPAGPQSQATAAWEAQVQRCSIRVDTLLWKDWVESAGSQMPSPL